MWGTFSDSQRFGGYVPQRQYFRNTFVTSPASLLQQDYFNRFMASLIGETACADHFHRPSKSVHVDGDRYSAGYLSIMNKYRQIIGQWVVFSLVMSELETPLATLHAKLVRLQGKVICQAASCLPAFCFPCVSIPNNWDVTFLQLVHSQNLW